MTPTADGFLAFFDSTGNSMTPPLDAVTALYARAMPWNAEGKQEVRLFSHDRLTSAHFARNGDMHMAVASSSTLTHVATVGANGELVAARDFGGADRFEVGGVVAHDDRWRVVRKSTPEPASHIALLEIDASGAQTRTLPVDLPADKSSFVALADGSWVSLSSGGAARFSADGEVLARGRTVARGAVYARPGGGLLAITPDASGFRSRRYDANLEQVGESSSSLKAWDWRESALPAIGPSASAMVWTTQGLAVALSPSGAMSNVLVLRGAERISAMAASLGPTALYVDGRRAAMFYVASAEAYGRSPASTSLSYYAMECVDWH